MEKDKYNGIKNQMREEMESLIGYTMADGALLDADVCWTLAAWTKELNREILIVTDDHGTVLDSAVGDKASVAVIDNYVNYHRRSLNRLRVFHTHPNGNPRLSEQDKSAAQKQKLEAMVAIAVKGGEVNGFGVGLPVFDAVSQSVSHDTKNQLRYEEQYFGSLEGLNAYDLRAHTDEINKRMRQWYNQVQVAEHLPERVLLVGVDTYKDSIDIDDSLAELRRLVETAGGEAVHAVIQKRPQPDPVFYVGRGKIMEIRATIQNENINTVVTNDELNTNQIAAIEALTGVKVVDRTTVILDIFAKHASTREGKLQVELAQQKYRISRLKGLGIVLSRTGGGIGTRGPGEKKLETDRRHIRTQIDELERKLMRIEKSHAVAARRREKNNIPIVSLIGYTNSGKSTLFNRLTESDVVVSDGLFITLDSTVRRVNDDKFGHYLLSDTVGFIEKLPHQLIESFKTTLKEVERADLLLHVVDITNPHYLDQIRLVESILNDIGVGATETLMVYNKGDALSIDQKRFFTNQTEVKKDGRLISAKTGEGLDALQAMISQRLSAKSRIVTATIPYGKGDLLSALHDKAKILKMDYREDGIYIKVMLPSDFPDKELGTYMTEQK